MHERKVFRVSSDRENLEILENSDGRSQGKVREFCCAKFTFGQFDHPNFENFLGEHAPLTDLDTQEFNHSLEKSGNLIPSGDWTP